MTFEEFLRRARESGCVVETSGRYTFVIRDAIAVRYTLETGTYALKRDRWRSDSDYVRTSVDGASRALSLPRK